MNVALLASESKKELMVQFCIAYCGILSRQKLCAPHVLARLISEQTDLDIERLFDGKQQILSRIAYNEIDLMLYFRDPFDHQSEANSVSLELLRECDVAQIPFATNIATGEMLIHGLERGDLDWREIYKGKV